MDDQKKVALTIKIIAVGLVIVAGAYFTAKAIQTHITDNALLSNYAINIPQDWNGKYVVEKNDTVTIVRYTKDPSLHAVLFEIKVFTQSQWDDLKKNNNDLKELTTRNGAVFAYDAPIGNPYKGESADEYQKMKDSIPGFITTFRLTN